MARHISIDSMMRDWRLQRATGKVWALISRSNAQPGVRSYGSHGLIDLICVQEASADRNAPEGKRRRAFQSDDLFSGEDDYDIRRGGFREGFYRGRSRDQVERRGIQEFG